MSSHPEKCVLHDQRGNTYGRRFTDADRTAFLALVREEAREAAKQGVQEALKGGLSCEPRCCSNCRMDGHTHDEHHQQLAVLLDPEKGDLKRNNEHVGVARALGGTAIKRGVLVVVTLGVGGLAALVWQAVGGGK